MSVQEFLTYLAGVVALIYVIRVFLRQFSHMERDPKCEDCPIPELLQKSSPPPRERDSHRDTETEIEIR
jgi:hypothetical protein